MCACRRWIENGVFERWCNVQLTYCEGAKRVVQCARNPITSIRLSAPPETVLAVLRDSLASVKVSDKALKRLGIEAAGWLLELGLLAPLRGRNGCPKSVC